MPFNIGGSAYTHGQWRSPTLYYSAGSTSANNSWLTLTWSGTQPTDSTLLLSLYNANTGSLLLGSQSLGSSPITLSGTSTYSGISLQVRVDAEWLTGSPMLYWYTLNYVGTPLGDRRTALTTVQSGT